MPFVERTYHIKESYSESHIVCRHALITVTFKFIILLVDSTSRSKNSLDMPMNTNYTVAKHIKIQTTYAHPFYKNYSSRIIQIGAFSEIS